MSHTFNDRTSYLAFRATWKNEYKTISQQIRDAKLAFKNSERAYSKGAVNWEPVYKARNTLQQLRYTASQLLTDLFKAKEYAAKLRAERIAEMQNGCA